MILVDTSVWSLALRRDAAPDIGEVQRLREALVSGEVVTTGLILQELLQGFHGPRSGPQIQARFASLPLLSPERLDHVEAAEVRNCCRRAGVQLGTIDALIGQLCIRHGLTLLTTDRDFVHAARHVPLNVWEQPS